MLHSGLPERWTCKRLPVPSYPPSSVFAFKNPYETLGKVGGLDERVNVSALSSDAALGVLFLQRTEKEGGLNGLVFMKKVVKWS